MRCARFGRKCGGYEGEKQAEELKPSPETAERALVSIVPAAPATQFFESDEESFFFHLYCDDVVRNLSGAFELPVWSRVILQASHGR